MSASSKSRSSAPVLPMTSGFQQSMSLSDRFYTPAFSLPEMSSSSSSLSAQSSNFYPRSTSPTRVSLIGSSQPSPSVRFAIDRPTSPGRSMSAITSRDPIVRPPISSSVRRKTCMCSPTTHPGSFRCSLHKGLSNQQTAASVSSPSNRLNARRSAMTNSLVRIGTVEGELVRRALTALIRPSSHHQRRRADFQPRQSRLSKMSKADDL
ncbi:uncharacterized protein LOC110100351 [Dendrobium catenatum]|uniref:Serine-rich protein-like protein n=1 Tax=Dendrobium catenatum TaxID=906689 RepID=A0A2I0XAN2_9ASPA|nr:uncharacterized protein LOC110100351 [Dendrobium catenatum]XP_020683478.1 uncharacterized protein LOC110100351 [Dendrobium catenatum]XP_028548766.1 uncharacterized protein LOC110100351 [Dendrobium catenatum]XP_028548767.1 uncharacterized protein LOC110100351 [Dendrobium catenatum]PKU84973.1 hypothetical protein MA16_Dca015189 [Dendrobium catenatum]